MARMYFSFKTNLKDSADAFASPQVDYIAFENKEAGKIISISCNGTSDYGVETGWYNARFKGLECQVSSLDGEETVHEYQEISEADTKLLNGATPYEVGIYFPSVESTLDEPVTIEELSISVEFGEKEFKFKEDTCAALEYGEDYEEEIIQ